ncbi:uncharacterized protein LAJ45_05348 [Morchella importuna]|uniref:uncharacterized protein n=1 Tax=Morchella importuna TaxID=1174673 RepID=UPI001E8D962E|nr:uncharacterized protein LAJ45_05348 [Morchella importuna]KAH8150652.1 hypothetical protein LAJ45_05348 [Morchella importuna]
MCVPAWASNVEIQYLERVQAYCKIRKGSSKSTLARTIYPAQLRISSSLYPQTHTDGDVGILLFLRHKLHAFAKPLVTEDQSIVSLVRGGCRKAKSVQEYDRISITLALRTGVNTRPK